MTNERPSVNPTKRYTQSEAARALGVDFTTIFRWRKAGKAKPCSTGDNGRVYYTGLEILRMWNNN